MKKKLVSGVVAGVAAAALLLSTPSFASTSVTGQGSSFAFNAIDACAKAWKPSNGDSAAYTATSSGKGRTAFANGTVNFAFSDAGYSSSDSVKPSFRYVNVPLVTGPIVFAYNKNSKKIPAGLKLDFYAVSGILNGSIAKWNDKQLVKLNPGKKLPDHAIQVYFRAGTSGTNKNLATYLNQSFGGKNWAISDNLAVASGNGSGASLAKGALGFGTSQIVANKVQDDAYGFGYFDLSDAITYQVNRALLKNKVGQFIAPSSAATAKFFAVQPAGKDSTNTLAGDATDGIITINYNAKVSGAYQASAVTYGLAPRGSSAGTAGTIENFYTYVLNTCLPAKAAGLGYAPLGGNLLKTARAQVQAIFN